MILEMMKPFLLMIAQCTESELAKCLEYSKAENKILRARLPENIQATPAERAELVRHAQGNPARQLETPCDDLHAENFRALGIGGM